MSVCIPQLLVQTRQIPLPKRCGGDTLLLRKQLPGLIHLAGMRAAKAGRQEQRGGKDAHHDDHGQHFDQAETC